jgi:hypothetical protein
VVSTIAGNNESGKMDGNGKNARFNRPVALVISNVSPSSSSSSSCIFVADKTNHCIRQIFLPTFVAVTTPAVSSSPLETKIPFDPANIGNEKKSSDDQTALAKVSINCSNSNGNAETTNNVNTGVGVTISTASITS